MLNSAHYGPLGPHIFYILVRNAKTEGVTSEEKKYRGKLQKEKKKREEANESRGPILISVAQPPRH